MKTRSALAGWLTIAALTLSAPAAQAAETWTTAKAAYEAGRTAYQAQRYADAVVAFEAAYTLSSSSGLLVNLAESYKRLGDCRTALTYYDRFKAIVAKSALRTEVDNRAAELSAKCETKAAPAAAASPAPPSSPEPAATAPAQKAEPPPPSAAAAVTTTDNSRAPTDGREWQAAIEAGVSSSNWGDVNMGTQPSIRVAASRSAWWGNFGLGIGVSAQWSRLKYNSTVRAPEAYTKTTSSWETILQAEGRLIVAEWLTLRAEVGGGVTLNSGFEAWNEVGIDGAATQGTIALPTARGSLGFEIPLTGALGIRVTPVALTYSPAPKEARAEVGQALTYVGSGGLSYGF